MSKWQCCVCGKREPCILPMVNDKEGFRPVCCPVDNTSGIKPYWLPVDETVTKCKQLPKLTAEVFDRPDCPAWAKWAAVDNDGEGWFYEDEPVIGVVGTFVNVAFRAQRIDGEFDATDWKNSLIERLPETMTEPEETDGTLTIRFKRLHPDAKAPYQATPGSAGFDLTAVSMKIKKETLLRSLVEYGTGLAVEIPAGHVGLVFPRSSIYKKQMLLTNSVGVIDSDYRGEIKAVFAYGGKAEIYNPGDRIAQLVIMPIPSVKFVEAEELTETQRGAGGYGSTGR